MFLVLTTYDILFGKCLLHMMHILSRSPPLLHYTLPVSTKEASLFSFHWAYTEYTNCLNMENYAYFRAVILTRSTSQKEWSSEGERERVRANALKVLLFSRPKKTTEAMNLFNIQWCNIYIECKFCVCCCLWESYIVCCVEYRHGTGILN